MDRYSLQFQGTNDWALLACMLGVVTALLVGYAAWQLARRRWRPAVIAFAAALSPAALVPVLLTDAWGRYRAGDSHGGRTAWLAGVVVAAAATLAAGLVVAAGKTAAAAWLAVLAVQTAVAVGVFYSAVYSRLGRARLAGLIALRCAALAALMVLLFKPALSIAPRADALRPALVILVDRSASMATVEADLPSRYAQAMQMLVGQQGRIERTFQPRWYHFGSRTEPAESLESLAQLTPAGEGTDATDIAAALRAAGRRSGPAGVLLVSDGIDNVSDNGVIVAAVDTGTPVYVAGVGSASETASLRRNIEILSVDAPTEATSGSTVAMTAKVRLTGLANSAAEARLVATDTDELIDVAQLWADSDEMTADVEFNWTAADPPDQADTPAESAQPVPRPAVPAPAGRGRDGRGRQVRRLAIEMPPLPGEARQADNRSDLHIVVTHPRIRLLYVEGTVRPEYKWLRRLLAGDQNVELVSMVRIDESRFWSHGSIGGQAVTALPQSEEDFALFDVIILGDLDSSFLTGEQMERLERFVADGGGLAMLGGHNSFGPGGYGGTPVERALPVIMGTREQPQASAPFGPQITAAGQAHPILAGIAGFFAGPGGQQASTDGSGRPPLSGCVSVVRAKAAASVLAVNPMVANAAGPLVVVAAQAYGRGRSVAFTADTTWRWRLVGQAVGADGPYERFWTQTVRWLASEDARTRRQVPAVVVRLEHQHVPAGREVNVLARAIGGEADVLDTAQATCQVIRMTAGQREAAASFSLTPEGRGSFAGRYTPRDDGDYTVRVSVAAADGREIGTDELPLTVAPAPMEMQRLARNEHLLRRIAERTGGRYDDIAGLPDLVDEMLAAHRRMAGAPAKPHLARMYHFPSLFVLFVAAVTAEWVLRRRWQLR